LAAADFVAVLLVAIVKSLFLKI
jgi:hypothetical protein